ncbi:hypothetical protein DL764_004792 [Monosporascus ibericus]|uniref:Uncharacterized protein n=1 Tax=Monosporascus ibericus TaxID=155417 RepID=A0A4Q4TBP2_9PEZI|nr:hypothetical protein DL764_004792 [Monosporascus ibericus]
MQWPSAANSASTVAGTNAANRWTDSKAMGIEAPKLVNRPTSSWKTVGAALSRSFLDSQSAHLGGPDIPSRVKSESSDSQSALALEMSPSQTQQPRITFGKKHRPAGYSSIPRRHQPAASTHMTFKDEWAEIAAAQQLPPGSQVWKEGRAKAMHEILEEVSLEGKVRTRRVPRYVSGGERRTRQHEEECKDAKLGVLVNTVDFIDNVRAGRGVGVRGMGGVLGVHGQRQAF